MKKETLSNIARRHGVDLSVIQDYRDAGVDVYDDSAIELYRSTLNETTINEYSIDDLPELAKEDFITMKFQKLTHETALKKAEATLKELEVNKRKGELVPINDVCEANMLVASKVKASMKKLTLSLPPRLDGLDVKDMSKIISEEIQDVLQFLYEEFNMEDDEQ